MEQLDQENLGTAKAYQMRLGLQDIYRLESVQEARQAGETVRATRPAHEAYVGADEALRRMQEQQTEKSGLAQQRSAILKTKVEGESQGKSARKQLEEDAAQARIRVFTSGAPSGAAPTTSLERICGSSDTYPT